MTAYRVTIRRAADGSIAYEWCDSLGLPMDQTAAQKLKDGIEELLPAMRGGAWYLSAEPMRGER